MAYGIYKDEIEAYAKAGDWEMVKGLIAQSADADPYKAEATAKYADNLKSVTLLRPSHQAEIEAAARLGDYAKVEKLISAMADTDPYKQSMIGLFGDKFPSKNILTSEKGFVNFPLRIGTENNPEVERLVALYKKSYQQIASELSNVSDAGQVQRASALRQIEKILTGLGQDTNKWLAENIPKQYQAGAAQAIAQLENLGATRTFYHGAGAAKALTSGGNMAGGGFYVTDSEEIAKKFGSKITTYSIKLSANEVLTVNSQAELKQLYMDAAKAFRGIPLEQAIPKYALKEGYKAIEISPAFDPLGGVNILDKRLLTAPARGLETGFTTINKSAVEALVSDAQKSFGDALSTVNRSARQIFNQATQQAIKDRLASGEIGGLDRVKIASDIKQIVADQGVAALTDKGGRQWTLDRYAEMLTRTKIVEARNTGLGHKLAQNGFDLVEVSSHGATDVCGDWEGKILSLSGQTDGYPTVDEATADGLFHPNCEHAVNAIVPDLSTLTVAYNPDSGEYDDSFSLRPPHQEALENASAKGDMKTVRNILTGMDKEDPYTQSMIDTFNPKLVAAGLPSLKLDVAVPEVNTNLAAKIFAQQSGLPAPKPAPLTSSQETKAAMDAFNKLKKK